MKTTPDIFSLAVAHCLLGMVINAAEAATEGEPEPTVTTAPRQEQIYKPWLMHHVGRDFLIANSLNAADVDGDGFNDYSVIDERRDLITIVFHPGKKDDVR